MDDIRHGAGGGDEATSKGHFVKRDCWEKSNDTERVKYW